VKTAVLALALLLVTTAHAAPTRDHPIEDAANLISDADQSALELELGTLRAQGVDLAVILINSTGRESIEAYARKRATAWATGTTPAAVLVLAIKDRKSRLEVSDPLRDKFPDARAKSILDNLKGYLRSADYPGAIRAVITEVRNGVGGVAPDMESPHPQVADPSADQPPEPAVVSPPVEQPSEYTPPPPRERDWTPIIYAILGGVVLLLAGYIWARKRIASRATLTAKHVITSDRSLFMETLWCACLIIGGMFYVGVLVLAMGSRRNSTWSGSSSRAWGSDYSSGSSTRGSSGGGGWSGGGASSGW
jgi:uncharacterized protein